MTSQNAHGANWFIFAIYATKYLKTIFLMKSPIGANIKIETILKKTIPFKTMAELSIPVATLVGAEMTQHSTICASIKSLRDSYREFCEDEDEYETTIDPIHLDPEPYANGTKKTRPILKKYAQALVDKLQLDQQLEAEAEAKRDANLTPQQVKADMKRYVSICEKKIAKQQEQCDALQKQVDQLSEVVKVLISDPHQSYQNLLTHCAMTDPKSLDYFMPHFKIEIEKEKTSTLHYAVYGKKIESVQKLLDAGANSNFKAFIFIDGNHIYEQGYFTPLEIASRVCSLELVKLLIDYGATTSPKDIHGQDNVFKVPNGPEGDLVAGYLQTHGSKPVTRF
jgi:hypothetical protein